jgi:hypothetical protein
MTTNVPDAVKPASSTAASSAAQRAALSYASGGWPVLPLWGIRVDGSCACGRSSCRSPAKHPIGALAPRGVHGASRQREVAQRWWAQPGSNVAIATGRDSGLVVDIDAGGDDTLAALEAEHGALPPTLEATTGEVDTCTSARPRRRPPRALGRSMASTSERRSAAWWLRRPGTLAASPTSGSVPISNLSRCPLGCSRLSSDRCRSRRIRARPGHGTSAPRTSSLRRSPPSSRTPTTSGSRLEPPCITRATGRQRPLSSGTVGRPPHAGGMRLPSARSDGPRSQVAWPIVRLPPPSSSSPRSGAGRPPPRNVLPIRP